jgi:type II secretory ATPase GspE/PulE/Tfp pilus assembly ATPase PilB-like protein
VTDDKTNDQHPRRPMRLGERLVHEKLVTEKQLQTALQEQRRTGSTLGEVLVSMGFLKEDDLCRVLAESQGVPFLDLGEVTPDTTLLTGISAEFARKHGVFPVERDGKFVVVAMARPMDILALDAVKQHCWRQVRVVAASPREVNGAITRYLESLRNREAEADAARQVGKLATEGHDDDAVAVTDRILDFGLRNMATDVHIEPEEKLLRVRYRIDGILEQGENWPMDASAGVLARIKILAGLDITERRLPQDGRIKLQRGKGSVDIRVSIMPTNHGENAVLRVLDKSSISLNLDELGVVGPERRELEAIMGQSNGMLLVSGPTGSGKSTTLYALLASVDSLTRKVITIEDPIEYEQPLIRQSQVDPVIGYTFAAGLRTSLRQDPDIILVGEIRDQETADVALKASLTGHFVMSSIHTNSAVGCVTRLLDLGIDGYLVASSLSGAVAQRLVRRICSRCKAEREATAEEALALGLKPEGLMLSEGNGCDACRGTGFAGRMAVYELFVMDDASARIVAQGGGEHQLTDHARRCGRRSMLDDARSKVLEGKTTVSEFLRVTPTLAAEGTEAPPEPKALPSGAPEPGDDDEATDGGAPDSTSPIHSVS